MPGMYKERLDQIIWRRKAFGAVVVFEAIGWLGVLLFGLGLLTSWAKIVNYEPAVWTIKSSFIWSFLVWSNSPAAVRITIYSALWALGLSLVHLVLSALWSEDL